MFLNCGDIITDEIKNLISVLNCSKKEVIQFFYTIHFIKIYPKEKRDFTYQNYPPDGTQ